MRSTFVALGLIAVLTASLLVDVDWAAYVGLGAAIVLFFLALFGPVSDLDDAFDD